MVGKGSVGPGVVTKSAGKASAKGKKFGKMKGGVPSFGFDKSYKRAMKGQAVKYGSA